MEHKQQCYLYIVLLTILLTINQQAFSQTQLSLPTEFQNLSTNSRALEKNFEFNLDKDSSQFTQNFALDKTGLILHIQTSPKIKDNTTKIKIFSNDGKEVEIFTFLDNTIFGLVDPEKTYFIVQEIMPSCNELAKAFNLDNSNIICPDTVSYKIANKIMLTSDTSFKVMLLVPTEFYKLTLSLPQNIQQFSKENFQNTTIIKSSEINNENPNPQQTKNINLASLLGLGRICFISSPKSINNLMQSGCSFNNTNIQTLIIFKEDFNNKISSNQNFDLAFPFIANTFKTLEHDYLFEFNENIKSQNPPVEISKKSIENLFLENSSSNLKLNLGQISTSRTKVKKNTFNLNNPIELNKSLNRVDFKLPLNKIEAIINPYKDINTDSVLTNLEINGKEKTSTNAFNISIDNNILIMNLLDPVTDKEVTNRLQTIPNNNLTISSYIEEGTFDLTLNRTYLSVEQTTAPSVDENGKSIEIINNKSKANLVLSTNFSEIDLTNQNEIILNIEQSSKLLNNNLFKNQLSLSGFIIPPDFRPVLEPGYRATIELSMIINLNDDNLVKINYSDLKAKDETPLTNFFSFSFLPTGSYNINLRFDADRTKLFQMAGVIKINQ